jgi:hypothetical protein
MTPASPVFPGIEMPEIVFGKDQPPYTPLPAYKDDNGVVFTRWHLTWRERCKVLFGGDLWLTVLTFNLPLQPVKIETEPPKFDVQS